MGHHLPSIPFSQGDFLMNFVVPFWDIVAQLTIYLPQ